MTTAENFMDFLKSQGIGVEIEYICKCIVCGDKWSEKNISKIIYARNAKGKNKCKSTKYTTAIV